VTHREYVIVTCYVE